MNKSKLDTWVWVLIYGGMLGASLGWFVHPLNPGLGWTLMAAGVTAAVVGAMLIFLRSRMGP
jgi:hypothetical protein